MPAVARGLKGSDLSIRIRLTVWYSGVLAAGLLLFAVAISQLLQRSLYHDLNRESAHLTRGLTSFLTEELKEPGVHLEEELEEYAHGLPGGSFFALFDEKGAKVFASKPGQSQASLHERYFLHEEHILLNSKQYRIVTGISTKQVEAILLELRLLSITLTPAVIALASLGGYLLSRQALKPVNEITKAARALSIHDLSQRLRVPKTGDELQDLSETWNSMLDRLADAVSRLSRFTQDASHELRTPLAIIRSTAELAIRKPRSPEAHQAAFQQIITESDRLTQLAQDLLLLARGDSLPAPVMQTLNLTALVTQVCEQLALLTATKGIQVLEWTPECECPITGDPALLRRLFIVLIENAINYSRPQSPVEVRIQRQEAEVQVTVADEGIGIEAADLPKIFDRFYRGEGARQAWQYGSGLGLSLAASIARQHGGEIRVNSQPGVGSRFVVAFPVS